jgi:hypothetical protein
MGLVVKVTKRNNGRVIADEACIMEKNAMRPVHPGEIQSEEYPDPMGTSVRARCSQ